MAGTFRNSRPLALAMKYFARAHIWAYQRTDGIVGARLLWFPAALVTTTGRKSGVPRTTPTLYLRDGDRVVLPASFGGRDAKCPILPICAYPGNEPDGLLRSRRGDDPRMETRWRSSSNPGRRRS